MKKVENLFFYNDLDLELQRLEEEFNELVTNIESDITKYRAAGIDIEILGQLEEEFKTIKDRVDAIAFDRVGLKISEYETLIHELKEIKKKLLDESQAYQECTFT